MEKIQAQTYASLVKFKIVKDALNSQPNALHVSLLSYLMKMVVSVYVPLDKVQIHKMDVPFAK